MSRQTVEPILRKAAKPADRGPLEALLAEPNLCCFRFPSLVDGKPRTTYGILDVKSQRVMCVGIEEE